MLAFLAPLVSLALAAPSLVAAPQSGGDPNLIVLLQDPPVLGGAYKPGFPYDCAGYPPDSPCEEALVGVYYPSGKGPTSLAFTNPPAPVFIALRGGNENWFAPGMLAWFQTHVLPHGYVGVDPNFAVIDPGEDFTVPVADIAYLIQWLRHHATWLNIDPQRIFLFGRSGGGLVALGVGLREDEQDLLSPDPIRHQSSRPQYVISYSAPTSITCFVDSWIAVDSFMNIFFPVSAKAGSTLAQQAADSATDWLVHPEWFQRTYTPPLFLGYKLASVHACEWLIDAHDGGFGPLLQEAGRTYALQSGDLAHGIESQLYDTGSDYLGFDVVLLGKMLEWCDAKLQPPAASLYLAPPVGLIEGGSVKHFEVYGCTPGSAITYAFSFQLGSTPLPGCPAMSWALKSPFAITTLPADAGGVARFSIWIPQAFAALPFLLQAVDVSGCRISNVLTQIWPA